MAGVGPAVLSAETDGDLGFGSVAALQRMHWRQFERLVADLWSEMGYVTEVRSGSNDLKIDVVVRKRGPGGKTLAIQVKRYESGNTITRTEVQEYSGLHTQIDADETLFVTSGEFNRDAETVADRLGIRLVDGENLLLLIRQHASYALYAKHADVLDIEAGELGDAIAERHRRTLYDELVTAGRTALGRMEVLTGQLCSGIGEAIPRVQEQGRRSRCWLWGYDPTIEAERKPGNAADTFRVEEPPEWAVRIRSTGRGLQRRGTARLEPALVAWQLSDVRSLVPSGVDPRIRARKWAALSRQASVVLLGALCCLVAAVAVTTNLPGGSGSYPFATLLVVGSLVGTTGIVTPSIWISRSAFDTVRAGYGLVAAAPALLWMHAGYPVVRSALPELAGVVLVSAAAFVAHTHRVGQRHDGPVAVRLFEGGQEYVPAHNPATVLGLLGSGVLWVGLTATSVAGRGPQYLVGEVGDSIIMVGLTLTVIACAAYVWRGGTFGVVAAVVSVGCILAFATLRTAPSLTTTVDTKSVLGVTLLVLLTGTVLLFATSHRRLARWQVLMSSFAVALGLEFTDYWLVGLVVDTYGTVGLATFLFTTAVTASLMFGTSVLLERHAVRATLAERSTFVPVSEERE